MLSAIREQITGWVARFILGLLFISFAVWGIGLYSNQGFSVEVAQVDGQGISQQDWRTVHGRLRARMQRNARDTLNEEDEALVKEQALDTLINAELLQQFVGAENMQLPDSVLRDFIINLDVFQGEDTAGFDRNLYEQGVVARGMTATFESELRMDLLSDQLRRALSDSAFVLEDEVQRTLELKEQRRDIRYVTFSADSFKAQVQSDEAAMAQWYQEHAERYRTPQQLRIAFLDLQRAELLDEIEVSEDVLSSYYEGNREQFDEEEKRSIQQLIARVPGQEATPEQWTDARDRMQAVWQRAAQEPDFQKLIERMQEEAETDIDFIEQIDLQAGTLPPAVDSIAFRMEEGAYSDPVETEQGIHLVRVVEIKSAAMQNTFVMQRDKVEEAYRAQEAELLFAERAELLINASYEHPDTLEVAALETGLSVQESDLFSEEGMETGILAEAPVLKAAFSEALRLGQNNSDGISLADDRMVVLRVIERRPPELRPLSALHEEVMEDWTAAQARERAKAQGEGILAALQAGEEVAELTEAHALEWIERMEVGRDDPELSRQILRAAFQAGRPDEGAKAYRGVQNGDGDYSLIEISAVRVPVSDDKQGDEENADQTDDEDAERSALQERARAEILRSVGAMEWQSFMTDLRERAAVQVYGRNL